MTTTHQPQEYVTGEPVVVAGGPYGADPHGGMGQTQTHAKHERWFSRWYHQVKEETKRSVGLARVTYRGLRPHKEIPAISLFLTLINWSIYVIIVACVRSIGASGVLLAFALTLTNQFIHVFCDAALMIHLAQARSSTTRPKVTAALSAVVARDMWPALGGLVLVSWAEGVVATCVLIVRGVCLAFILPFRLCLRPFVLDKTPTVDSVLQLTMALVFVVQQRVSAAEAANRAEEYLTTNIGPRPQFYRTINGFIHLTLFPLFLLGILLAACGASYAAGWSLVFLAISVAQWLWNLTAHMLCYAHHNLVYDRPPDPYTSTPEIVRSAFYSPQQPYMYTSSGAPLQQQQQGTDPYSAPYSQPPPPTYGQAPGGGSMCTQASATAPQAYTQPTGATTYPQHPTNTNAYAYNQTQGPSPPPTHTTPPPYDPTTTTTGILQRGTSPQMSSASSLSPTSVSRGGGQQSAYRPPSVPPPGAPTELQPSGSSLKSVDVNS